MRLWKLFSFLLLLAPSFAMAQVGLYGEFSTTNIRAANEPEIYGITFGGYDEKSFNRHLTFLSLGPDFRVSLQSGSASASNVNPGGGPAQSLISAQAGPRVAFKLPVAALHPYVEGLIGGVDLQIGEVVGDTRFHNVAGSPPGTNSNGGISLSGQALGGLDLTVRPRVDWRVVEVGYARLFESSGSPSLGIITFSTGIVVRLP
ncbi:MAG: hypothetical protein ACYCOR_08525 [Acidobacteriaceae bacterium]